MVRISKLEGAFDQGYIPKCSEEHFLVHSDKSSPMRIFKMSDKVGEVLKGAWFPEEVLEIATNRFLKRS